MRSARTADQLDRGSDGCPASPDQPFGFAFRPACERHDLGCRDDRRQGRLTSADRLRVDDRFLVDVYSICGGDGYCRPTARVHYRAARIFSEVGHEHRRRRRRGAEAIARR